MKKRRRSRPPGSRAVPLEAKLPHVLCDRSGEPVPGHFRQRCRLGAKMKLEFEFFTGSPIAGPVDFHSVVINWSRPKFRITTIPGEPQLSSVSGFAGRPHVAPIRLNRWYSIPIVY